MRVLRYECFAPGIVALSTERGTTTDKCMPYSGFNINPYCGDDEQHVSACRAEICTALGIETNRLVLPHQVHDIVVANADRGDSMEGADAVMTSQAGLCIGVSTADCIPVLLHDVKHDALCAVHSGWRGTVRHITEVALEAMADAYGTRREDVVAAIGPGIRTEAFEVGDEVYGAFADGGFDMGAIAVRMGGRWHINLVGAVQSDLVGVGRVYDCGICTYTHYDRFFSARRLGVNSGRIYTGIIIT